VIVGCSRRKLDTAAPVPALDLYQGWCVPQLRQRVGTAPDFRARSLVLSARHGLVGADTPLTAYEQPLTPQRAAELRDPVREALREHLAAYPTEQALLLLEPAYLDLVGIVPVSVVHTITDPVSHWGAAVAVLDAWGWPPETPSVSGRVFQGKRTWHLGEDAFAAAAALLAGYGDTFQPELVIGLARGGVPLARRIGAQLGLPVAEVAARHNTSDAIGVQATGTVELDAARLVQSVGGARSVLVVDDICGSGATLRAATDVLLRDTSATVRTAVLCRNAGAAFPVNAWVWDVADWVCFPWENRPAPADSTPLPLPHHLPTPTED
jgi:hypoxanthine phosphoribosyltransferase